MLTRYVPLLLLVACAPPAAHILLEPDDVDLGAKGETATIVATGTDEYQKPASVDGLKWESSDPAIATVDDKGVVTAVSSGDTTIKASIGDVYATAQVGVDILATAEAQAATFLVPGDVGALTFTLTNDKGSKYVSKTPTCASDSPAIELKDGKLYAKSLGSANITCTLGTTSFGTKVAVIPADVGELARSGAAAGADYKWIRDTVVLAPQVKRVGADRIKLTKFAILRSKERFTFVFCGTSEPMKMQLNDDKGVGITSEFTGPCPAATFSDDAPPWRGGVWNPMLVELANRGITPAKDESVEVSASAPDTWTVKGGGRTHVVMKNGVIQP
jgi:hypothetical protein